jgi:hypothetical protein
VLPGRKTRLNLGISSAIRKEIPRGGSKKWQEIL